ncbi:hypothetical protein ACFL02_06140 [Planctomycetota bacterium]
MEHISDIIMLDMLGGHIAEPQKGRAMGHINSCPECRRRWGEFSQTWQRLDDVPADSSQIDLLDRINSALVKSAEPGRYLFIRPLLRIAASVLLAVAVGHVAGKLSLRKSQDYWQNAAARAVHLDTLLPGSATGWAEPILEDEALQEDSTP